MALAARLPAHMKAASLYALEAEDHYLRVHSDRGEALVHMRMTDAETMLGTEIGARVHRSFWIARSAIVGVERRGNTIHAHLATGLAVPISRRRYAMLAANGLFSNCADA